MTVIQSGEAAMSRVALVTGGTRGIGEAISKALKQAGYKVAANYAGNDQVAQKFKAATGIAVYKWDVSSFESCAAAKRVVAKFLRDLPYAFRDNNSQAVKLAFDLRAEQPCNACSNNNNSDGHRSYHPR
jgi:acetoacetyl-CoA reductase